MLSVIMAGGVGERFWPRSRRKRPKQLIDLTGKGSMIALTVSRVSRLSKPEEIFVLTSSEQADAVRREVGTAVPRENIIGEPVGRNTGPTIGLAAVVIRHRYGNRPFAVLPADHLVDDIPKYEAAFRAAERYVDENGGLLTFGIKPSRPDTGYGYIAAGRKVPNGDGIALFRADAFHEKPDTRRAMAFLEKGNYYWNSGMFLWKPEDILAAIRRHLPALHAVLEKIDKRLGTEKLEPVLKATYADAPSISIDYGVLEKADNVVVLPGEFYWNDVGSWESIREIYPMDEGGNVVVGDHLLIDSSENTVFSPERLVGLVGLSGVVVVDGGDAILVCKRETVQQVRDLVRMLKDKKKEKYI